MSAPVDRLDQVRRVLAAGGGWNRRSRAALVSWARAEGLSEAALATLLSQALGIRVPEPSKASGAPEPTPGARSRMDGAGRWWLALIAAGGLAVSAFLVARLTEAVTERTRVTGGRSAPAAPVTAEPTRTLPPPPVPFAQPPSLEAPDVAPQAAVESLGSRPAGELSRLEVKRFGDAWRTVARHWTSTEPLARAAALRELASWIAGSASPTDVKRLLQSKEEARADMAGTRAGMLADAFDAMLAAEVARAPGLSSAAASWVQPGTPGGPDAALRAWCEATLPSLASEYASPKARERWTAWLACMSAIADAKGRTACTLRALDAIVRSGADIGRPGAATDAAGSLVASLPVRPDDPAFAVVRDAWAAWLSDASLPSARLWALGGIWRARDPSIDAALLPGERDAATTRQALALRWKEIQPRQDLAWWGPAQAERARPHPPASDPPERRLDDLAMRIRLVRRLGEQARLGQEVPARMSSARGAAQEPGMPRWREGLLDRTPEARIRTLRVMQGAVPRAIAAADAEALAARALSGPTSDEVALAQDVVRGSLREASGMRAALAHELAVAAEPRRHAEFLQDVVGGSLPGDASDTLRAAAIASLLRSSGAADGAAIRVADQLVALEGREPAAEEDPGAVAWRLAEKSARLAQGLRVPESVQPIVDGLETRVRRLRAIAPAGPRALASALAVLADGEAVRLAVRRPADADALRLLADEAAVRRGAADDALEQAAISLDAVVDMRLLATGEAPVTIPAARLRRAVDTVAAAHAMGQADAALAASPVQAPAARAWLRRTLEADASWAPAVALGMAEAASTDDDRSRWIEAARLLGAGATLPDPEAAGRREGLAAAQALAWSARAQTDRLVPTRLPAGTRASLEAFASATGRTLEACVQSLRDPADPRHADMCEALRARVARLLGGDRASWSDALAGGGARAVPEADPCQPARFSLPTD